MIGSIISKLASWLLQLAQQVFVALWSLVVDLAIGIADLFLIALGAILAAIPAPTFLQAQSLSVMFANIDPSILYFVAALKIGQGLAFLGMGVAFRLTRKIATLFQW